MRDNTAWIIGLCVIYDMVTPFVHEQWYHSHWGNSIDDQKTVVSKHSISINDSFRVAEVATCHIIQEVWFHVSRILATLKENAVYYQIMLKWLLLLEWRILTLLLIPVVTIVLIRQAVARVFVWGNLIGIYKCFVSRDIFTLVHAFKLYVIGYLL